MIGKEVKQQTFGAIKLVPTDLQCSACRSLVARETLPWFYSSISALRGYTVELAASVTSLPAWDNASSTSPL